MKSYSESKGEENTSWDKEIDNYAKGRLNHADIKRLKSLAGEWTTCACGNLCNSIPRHKSDNILDGEPVDKELSRHGYNFGNLWNQAEYLEQSNNDIAKQRCAKKLKLCLQNIEARSLVILLNMGIIDSDGREIIS